MTEAPSAPFHIGLTAEIVIEAAVELTQESTLFSWSLRDLAGRLGVAPSVIYHHVGGKDLLCRRVVEFVFAMFNPPPAELEWKAWFRQLLYSIGPLALRYRGVAKWLLMHGPMTTTTLPALDAGIAALTRAGFAQHTGFAYSALVNSALLTISMGDDRLQHEDDGPRDHATMMKEFEQVAANSPGAQTITEAVIRPFAEGKQEAAEARAEYYQFVVETTIAGLANRLASGFSDSSNDRV
ncbi:TetR/AcrR family transcriptional regulator [Glutamicibacter ardleyensis]|uniref:TetR/AcrR family transcriptional regulator n=1 Tax=Glutamicibacter ardleyensis TaxID=225894 RepID=UPI003FD0156D